MADSLNSFVKILRLPMIPLYLRFITGLIICPPYWGRATLGSAKVPVTEFS